MIQLIILVTILISTFCAASLYTIRDARPDVYNRAPVYALSILVVTHVVAVVVLTGIIGWVAFQIIYLFTS